jgi:hypothetical protein
MLVVRTGITIENFREGLIDGKRIINDIRIYRTGTWH